MARPPLVVTALLCFLLPVLLVRAADGQVKPPSTSSHKGPATDPAETKSKSQSTKASSPDPLKGVLREAMKLTQAEAETAARQKGRLELPNPATFGMRFTEEFQADVLRSIGQAEARLGDLAAARSAWQSALDATSAVSSLEASKDRATLYTQIAEAQIEAGDRDEARFTLREAIQAVRSIRPGSPFPFEPPPGMEIGSDSATQKSESFRRIAKLQEKVGESGPSRETLLLAITTAESIRKSLNRVHVLAELAQGAPAELAEELWQKAFESVKSQTDEFLRAKILDAILRARCRNQQVDQALTTVADRLEGDLRNYGLWVISDAIADGDQSVRREAVERLSQLVIKADFDRPFKKLKVFRRLAEAQARLGLYEAAYKTIGEPQPVNNVQAFSATQARINVMTAVAAAQLKAKQRDAARETVNAALESIAPLPDEDAEAYFPLSELGNLLSQLGDSAGALEIVQTVSRSASQVHILADLAVSQFRAGQHADARQTMERAIAASRSAPNDAIWRFAPSLGTMATAADPTQWLRQEIAQTLARIGDLDAALKIVNELDSSDRFGRFTRKNAVEQIVAVRLEAGDAAGARRTANLIPDSDMMFQDDKTNLMEKIARYQAEHGEEAAVLDWAGKTSSPRGRLQLIRGLADGIAARLAAKKDGPGTGDSQARAKPEK